MLTYMLYHVICYASQPPPPSCKQEPDPGALASWGLAPLIDPLVIHDQPELWETGLSDALLKAPLSPRLNNRGTSGASAGSAGSEGALSLWDPSGGDQIISLFSQKSTYPKARRLGTVFIGQNVQSHIWIQS